MKATKYILSTSLLVLLVFSLAHFTRTIPDSLEEPTSNISHSETTISHSETNSQLRDDSSSLSEEKEEFAYKTLHDYAYVGKSVREKEYTLLPTKPGINLATKLDGKRIVIQVTVGSFTVSHIQYNGKKWQLIRAPHTRTLKSYGEPQLPYKKVFIPVTSKLKTFKVENNSLRPSPMSVPYLVRNLYR